MYAKMYIVYPLAHSMKITLPATQVRKQFFEIISKAAQPGSSVTITLEGHPKVVMMSVEEFEGWEETLEILSKPALLKDLKESKKQIEEGKTVPWETLKKKFKL